MRRRSKGRVAKRWLLEPGPSSYTREAVTSQPDLIALLKATAPSDWPRLWGAIWGIREAAEGSGVVEADAQQVTSNGRQPCCFW